MSNNYLEYYLNKNNATSEPKTSITDPILQKYLEVSKGKDLEKQNEFTPYFEKSKAKMEVVSWLENLTKQTQQETVSDADKEEYYKQILATTDTSRDYVVARKEAADYFRNQINLPTNTTYLNKVKGGYGRGGTFGGIDSEKKDEYNMLITAYERGIGKSDEYSDYTLLPDFETVSSDRSKNTVSGDDFLFYYNKIDARNFIDTYTIDGQYCVKDLTGDNVDETYYDRNPEPEISDPLGLFLTSEDDYLTHAMANSGAKTNFDKLLIDGACDDWRLLDDSETAIYYYILNKQGTKAARDYLDDMAPTLNQRAYNNQYALLKDSSGLVKVAANIASVPLNVFGGVPAFIEDTVAMIKGDDINPYSKAHWMSNTAGAARDITIKDIDGENNDNFLTWGKVYGAVMSAADSYFGGVVLGPTGYGVSMGMNAAVAEAKELFENGASAEQIASLSLLTGAAEMVFEKVSLDKLIKINSATTLKQVVKNTLLSMAIEGSEEMTTELADTISNIIVLGSQSDYEKDKRAYMESGDSEDSATFRAILKNFVTNEAEAGFYGALSGGLFGAVSSVKSYGEFSDNTKTLYKGDIDAQKALIAEGKESSSDSKAFKLADKFSQRLDNGKELSVEQLNNQITANEKIKDYENISRMSNKDAENNLSDIGNSEGVKLDVFSGRLSDNGYKSYNSVIKGVEAINKRTGNNLTVTVIDSNNVLNGCIKDNNIYIAADVFDSGDPLGTVIHEYGHFGEKSAEQKQIFDLISSDTSIYTTAQQNFFQANYSVNINNNGNNESVLITPEVISAIENKSEEQRSERDNKIYNYYRTELTQIMNEKTLGNESFIKRIARDNKGIVGKIINKIKDLIELLRASGSQREELKKLRQIEQLYIEALKSSEKNKENDDSNDFGRYSRKPSAENPAEIDNVEQSDADKQKATGEAAYRAFSENAPEQSNDKRTDESTAYITDEEAFAAAEEARKERSKYLYKKGAKNKERLETARQTAEFTNAERYFDTEETAAWKAAGRNKTVDEVSRKIYKNIVHELTDEETMAIVGDSKNIEQAMKKLTESIRSAIPKERYKASLRAAKYLVDNVILIDVYNNGNYTKEVEQLSAVKKYFHKINLSNIKESIRVKYGSTAPILLFGKNDSNITADMVIEELNEEGLNLSADTEEQAFFALYDNYTKCREIVKEHADRYLRTEVSKEELKKMYERVANDLMREIMTFGNKSSTLYGTINRLQHDVEQLKYNYAQSEKMHVAKNQLKKTIEKLSEYKHGLFVSASKFDPDTFKSTIEGLTKIVYAGNVSDKACRKAMLALNEWYTPKNELLTGSNEANDVSPSTRFYDKIVSEEIGAIAKGKGELTIGEVKSLNQIVLHLMHIDKTYDKIFKDGKYIDAKPVAEKQLKIMQLNKDFRLGVIDKLLSGTMQKIADPMTVARRMDLYNANGFWTTQLEEIRNGTIKQAISEMRVRKQIDTFLEKNKNYIDQTWTRTIKLYGEEMPVNIAISLCLTLDREQAKKGLLYSGFTYFQGDTAIHKNVWIMNRQENIDNQEKYKDKKKREKEKIDRIAMTVQHELIQQFNELDIEYILYIKQAMLQCREIKQKTDMRRLGISNVIQGEYFPIRRFDKNIKIDSETVYDEINHCTHASFNHESVEDAQNELLILPVDSTVSRHINGVTMYENLSHVIENFNIIYNMEFEFDGFSKKSIRKESTYTWTKGFEYYTQILKDVQHMNFDKKIGDGLFKKLRSGFAKSQLGANIKVLCTQMTSLAASTSILDPVSVVKGFTNRADDVDKYCELAELRNYSGEAAMAQGLLDRNSKIATSDKIINKKIVNTDKTFGRLGDLLMQPIGMVDRFVIKRLFVACQAQVEKDGGAKSGTDENKKAAGELLTKVIIETQQNAFATDRSALMRDGNEYLRALTMFTADAMKVSGRVIDALGEYTVVKKRWYNEKDELTKIGLRKKLEKVGKKVSKAVAAQVTVSIMMTLITYGITKFYGNDDEDENIINDFTVDFIGNMIGSIPFIKDVYGIYSKGYEINNYNYTMINDVFKSLIILSELVPKAIRGDYISATDVCTAIRKTLYAASGLLGLPIKNVYNLTVGGIIGNIDKGARYKIESAFYKGQYRTDLAKAIEEDDEDMINTIAGLIINENVGDIKSKEVREELNRLIGEGYSNILPSAAGKISRTVDGVKYEKEMSAAERKRYNNIRIIAYEEIERMIAGESYKYLSPECRADAIMLINSVYTDYAKTEILGAETATESVKKKTLFFDNVSISHVAAVISRCKAFTSDKDKNGNTIQGSLKKKIVKYIDGESLSVAEKYMLFGYLGYKNSDGKSYVVDYLKAKGLKGDAMKEMLKICGYD